MYYRGAKAAVIVLDCSLEDCTKKTESWLEDLKQFADTDCVVSLAINKIDLIKTNEQGKKDVDISSVQQLLKKNSIPVFKTSAITGEGISQLFMDLAVRAQENEAAASASAAELIGGSNEDRKVRGRSNSVGGANGSGGDGEGGVIDLDDLDNIGNGESGGMCC